jgi:excinuclease ABC subunit A
MSEPAVIRIQGARQHNLKNLNLEIPRDRFVVITGVSGSGKSSLAFDTLYAEGQRRYVESLSAYARQFLDQLEKPDVDFIEGLTPAIAIEQRSSQPNPRSTIATATEIYDYLRILYAALGQPHDPETGTPLVRHSIQDIVQSLTAYPERPRSSFSRRSASKREKHSRKCWNATEHVASCEPGSTAKSWKSKKSPRSPGPSRPRS